MVSCLLKAQPVERDLPWVTVTLTLMNPLPSDHFRLEVSCYLGKLLIPTMGWGWSLGRGMMHAIPIIHILSVVHSKDSGEYLGECCVGPGLNI